MAKTAIVWLMVYAGGGLAAFVKGPRFALFSYIFTYYTLFSWASGAPKLRYSMIMSVVLFLTFLIFKSKLDKNPITIPPMKYLLLLLADMVILTQFAADDPIASNYCLSQFFKTVVIYYLIITVVRTKSVFLQFIWIQLWGYYLFGWQAYTVGEIVSGRLENIGGPGAMSSNYLASHILLFLPFLLNFILYGNKWERLATLIAVPFIGNAFIQCNSRGSFLGMFVEAGAGLILFKGRKTWIKIIGMMIIIVPIAFQFVPRSVIDRFETIATYEEDASSTSRLTMWMGALDMISDHPVGSGGGGFEINSYFYASDVVEANDQDMAVHNTYLMLATDWGIQGLIVWSLFVASTLLLLHKIRRKSKEDKESFFYQYSIAIELGLLGYLASIFFGNRIYSETFYWFCALAVVLWNIQVNSINKARQENSELAAETL